MYYQFDEAFNISCFEELVNIPSPVGYDILMKPVLEKYAAMFGCNVKVGVFGMAVSCSHGRERTHLEGLRNTMDLLIGYVLGV